MDRLERTRGLREEYESALDEAELRRAAYHREIIKLHRSGMSLREIADGLGISHQRVHQIANGSAVAERHGRRVAARAAVTALMLVGASGLGFFAGYRGDDGGPARVSPSPSPQPSSLASCLRPFPVPGASAGASVAFPVPGADGCPAIAVIDPTTGEIVAVTYEGLVPDLSALLEMAAMYVPPARPRPFDTR